MACGYAMYTDKLGFCFATAGPGAFNLFSGLAVAMSDSYPVLAVSGYASLEWKGKRVAQRDLGRQPHARLAGDVRGDDQGSFLLTDIDDTCDVLEEAVNLAFEGRPGPGAHPRPREPDAPRRGGRELPRHPASTCAPVTPDPGARRGGRRGARRAPSQRGEKVVALVGFGAIRSGAGAEVRRLIERFQIPLLTTLDGKGIVSEGHPLSVGVFCDSGHASAWKAFLEADVVLCIGNALNQHATFNYREDLFEGKTLIHINISEPTRSTRRTRPTTRSSPTRSSAVAALYDALEPKVGQVPPVEVDGQRLRGAATSCT